MKKTPIGSTGLNVTPLCFGTSSLGNMPDTYGYDVTEERARDTLRTIFESPVNFLDTSNNYGFGRSEERIGAAFREVGGLPKGFVLSTKLDREMETGRFDARRVRQSLDETLARLGIDRIPLLHLHDPEHSRDLDEVKSKGGALDELFKLKEEGIAQSVGLAMGRLDIMESIIRDWPFDALINHNRFTLLNRSADSLFEYAHGRGIAILNAAPYAGGVLAKGSADFPKITYQPASDSDLEPVRKIEAICARHGVAPGALALQFSMKDPRICSTIVGVSRKERVEQTFAWASASIPDAVWDEIGALPYSVEDPEANRVYKPG